MAPYMEYGYTFEYQQDNSNYYLLQEADDSLDYYVTGTHYTSYIVNHWQLIKNCNFSKIKKPIELLLLLGISSGGFFFCKRQLWNDDLNFFQKKKKRKKT